MSDSILVLIRLLHKRTRNRGAQRVMMKAALTFLGVINPNKGLAGVEVSIIRSAFAVLFAQCCGILHCRLH